MSKEQVMDYVMNSPANTNPNVLSGMLDGISGTQLPSPTESDNGKVLGVDGGEYKLVEQSGGQQIGQSGSTLRIRKEGKTVYVTFRYYDASVPNSSGLIFNIVKNGFEPTDDVTNNRRCCGFLYCDFMGGPITPEHSAFLAPMQITKQGDTYVLNVIAELQSKIGLLDQGSWMLYGELIYETN